MLEYPLFKEGLNLQILAGPKRMLQVFEFMILGPCCLSNERSTDETAARNAVVPWKSMDEHIQHWPPSVKIQMFFRYIMTWVALKSSRAKKLKLAVK